MKRREFIAAFGASLAGLARAHAQQPGKLPVVGFIVPGTEQSHGKWVAAFTAHLAELGWVEGRTVVLAYRWAAGHAERYPALAAELAALKADVIVTSVSGAVT